MCPHDEKITWLGQGQTGVCWRCGGVVVPLLVSLMARPRVSQPVATAA
jgi:hypothetical protein